MKTLIPDKLTQTGEALTKTIYFLDIQHPIRIKQNSHISHSLVTVRSPLLSYSSLSRELTASEVKAIFTCNGDPKGDLIEWTQSKWAKEGEADFSPIRVTEFCAKPFSSDMVRWQIRGYC